ncbi:MAG TPA: CheR family methyltransferase [Terracidiphilus sp.]|jgi:chemotaxis protein methyltransferase WspC|nr:CheR family methyltransferase [Terracidiphilus sp.]
MKSHITIEKPMVLELAQRLAAAAGLDADSLDPGRMQWAVAARCRHLRISSAAAYFAFLDASSGELTGLIDSLVIQETRFFRDPAVFEHIGHWAQRAAANIPGPLRILSAPCSSGQEAYSLAATFHSAGIPLPCFSIDAFDISSTALETARRGVYPDGALQQLSGELQSACGELRNQHWHMHEYLRDRIRFERRNLADPGALQEGSGYHLILCRNLLIYLHAGARAVLVQSLTRALLPGGRLILGTGDRVPELNVHFAAVKPAASFAFTHKQPVAIETSAASVPAAASIALIRTPMPRATRSDPQPQTPLPPAAAAEFYRRALEYMEHGNLRQAERRCRQALYLAPEHLPSLELLQTLWHLHPSSRLRHALKARIYRARKDADPVVAPQRYAEGESA